MPPATLGEPWMMATHTGGQVLSGRNTAEKNHSANEQQYDRFGGKV